MKRTNWILLYVVQDTPITRAPTFYTDANKSGKAVCKSKNLSKVDQSPYDSVQKSELYTILTVLRNFKKSLNIVTDSQYAERDVLYIKTAKFIPADTELALLFIQLQDKNQE